MSKIESLHAKPFKRTVIVTQDGSSSIMVEGMNETYHSTKGAITESVFIYIDHGFMLIQGNQLNILEIGMGTGLNVLLTYMNAGEKKVNFHTLEPHPLIEEEWKELNYAKTLHGNQAVFDLIHNLPMWEQTKLSSAFELTKYPKRLEDFDTDLIFDLIYFDAFAPSKQAKPWCLENIEKLATLIKPDGILTTYCAQGEFKRNLKRCGFEIQNPKGPMGKWEITVATKRA